MTSGSLGLVHTLLDPGVGYDDTRLLDLRTGPKHRLPGPMECRRVQEPRMDNSRTQVLLAVHKPARDTLLTGGDLTVVTAQSGLDLVVLIRPTSPDTPQVGFILTLRQESDRSFRQDTDRGLVAMLRTVPGLWRDSYHSHPDPEGAAERRAVLVAAILDPDAWLTSRDRTPPTPGSPEAVTALRDMLGWASLGVEHEWQARRWRRYQVRTPAAFAGWREYFNADRDDDLRALAPHVPNPRAHIEFSNIPVTQRARWARVAPAAAELAPAMIQHGWRPGDAARVIYAIDFQTSMSTTSQRAKDILSALAAEPGLTSPVAAAAIAAGMSLDEIIAEHRSGALDGSMVDRLRLMAALRA